MRTCKKLLSLLPALLLWLMLCVFLWGFVFNRLTDTGRAQKLTLCVDTEVPGATELAVWLEEALAGAVRMVKVRPFSYAMFDSATLTQADLFLVPAADAETYRDWFRPLPQELWGAAEELRIDGEPWGLLAHDPARGPGASAAYIDYAKAEGGDAPFYLLFGRQSLHVAGNEGAVDNLAVTAARLLLTPAPDAAQ